MAGRSSGTVDKSVRENKEAAIRSEIDKERDSIAQTREKDRVRKQGLSGQTEVT